MSAIQKNKKSHIGLFGSPPAVVGLMIILLLVGGSIQLFVGLSWQMVVIEYAIVITAWLLSAMVMSLELVYRG